MSLDFDAYWYWMIVAVVLGAAEILIPGVFLIWIAAAAAITGLVTLVAGPPVALQFTIFAGWRSSPPGADANGMSPIQCPRQTRCSTTAPAGWWAKRWNSPPRSSTAVAGRVWATANGTCAGRTLRRARACG